MPNIPNCTLSWASEHGLEKKSFPYYYRPQKLNYFYFWPAIITSFGVIYSSADFDYSVKWNLILLASFLKWWHVIFSTVWEEREWERKLINLLFENLFVLRILWLRYSWFIFLVGAKVGLSPVILTLLQTHINGDNQDWAGQTETTLQYILAL